VVVLKRQYDVISRGRPQFDLNYAFGSALIAGLYQSAVVVSGVRDAPVVSVVSQERQYSHRSRLHSIKVH
jgi:hypothetical protein